MSGTEKKPVTVEGILRVYVTLTCLSTLAASFIWGINTLFLLDAGLSVTQAFAANAFFTAGQVLFEVPTGVVADMRGRRVSYLLGAATLFVSTLLYLLLWRTHGPFLAWALVSMLLGLGFTFFSGATEAWLVDGLKFARYEGTLEAAFARGQMATGAAMLTGTLTGGVVAQFTNLGVPYLLRSVVLGLTFAVALLWMRDVGFTPERSASMPKEIRRILRATLQHGFRNPPVRWLMLAAPFQAGVGIYAFYAMQPFLLELYGRKGSYAVAGLAASLVAGAQILGGAVVPHAGRMFRRRTTLLIAGSVTSALALAAIGLAPGFVTALALLGAWAIVFAAVMPVRQAFLNGLIPSDERATVLSSYNLLGSSGGVLVQPALGRAADVWGYATSYLVGAGIEILALPFVLLARRERAPSDPMRQDVSGDS
ncbi:MAG TPA: MFS transporter [Candidatus Polarisedimenticolia bacterium]|jgi:MFS family permease|nr:MFS transporter [Candidatus Polarisedimenticolia bacterium]